MSTPPTIYEILTELDRLEDLREDLQEFALRGGATIDEDEDDVLDEAAMLAEMQAVGVRTLGDLEERIAALNEQLDQLEADEGGA
jgi:uncharacterized small protein (DUF1192 family)